METTEMTISKENTIERVATLNSWDKDYATWLVERQFHLIYNAYVDGDEDLVNYYKRQAVKELDLDNEAYMEFIDALNAEYADCDCDIEY